MTKAKVTFPSAPDTSAIDIEDEGSLIVSNPTVMNFTGPGVTVTENPTGTAEVDIPGLQYWTESEDATIQQSTIFTPNNAATDVNAVLLPKGTGANTAQTPDGTTAGGNARGEYATDWQKERSAASLVASGDYSTISGGRRNSAVGLESSVIGGDQNQSSGKWSVSGGHNSQGNGIASVAIGYYARVNSNYSLVLGGLVGTASANQSAIIGGNYGITSGIDCVITGGQLCKSIGLASRSMGDRGMAYANYMDAIGNSVGLTLDGARQTTVAPIAADTTQDSGVIAQIGILTPPDANRAYNVIAQWTAVVIGISGTATGVNVGDYMTQCNLFGFKRVAGTGSITSVTTVATHGDASITGSASMIFDVSSNNLRMRLTAPTFSGGGSLTLRTIIRLQMSEIAWTV